MFDQSKSILLVEDNHDHAELVFRSLEENKITTPMKRVADGEEALDYLQKLGKYSESTHLDPNLILLDLNLPGMSGHEILHEMAKHPSLKKIPVIVLTTSDSAMDMVQSYNEYAKGFITKPIPPEKFDQLVKGLDQSWFNVA